MEVDPAECSQKTVYRTMTTAVVPRPIAWISSISTEGDENLAPYSHFNNACAAPPVIMFSAGTHGGLKDTAKNALETNEFVVNVVPKSLIRQMDDSSASLGPDESEFNFANVSRAESSVVTPPRVAESPVNLECILHDSKKIYNNMLIFGEVVMIHVDDDVTTDGKIDMEKISAVGRLGGPYYTETDIIDYERQY